jgi:hypothetical protein
MKERNPVFMLEHIDREAATKGYQGYYFDLVWTYSILNERETALQYLDSLTSRVVLLENRSYHFEFPLLQEYPGRTPVQNTHGTGPQEK